MVKKIPEEPDLPRPKREPVYINEMTYDKDGKYPNKKQRIEVFESKKLGKLHNGVKVILIGKKWCAVN